MKIMLPVDGSSYTKKMLAWLVTHEDWLSGSHELTVMTVIARIPPHAASMFTAEDLHAYYETAAEDVFKPIRAFLAAHDFSTQYVHEVGHAGECIANRAMENPHDLIVMGSHGHGGLLSLVMGSVVTQVLARCTTPLLLVR